MALMREAGRYDAARGSLAAYLYGIARHHVLRALERERPFVPIDEAAAEGAPSDEHTAAHETLLDELARGETIDRVRQAVLALPPHYREVVVLCELHEMSYTEAAAVMGCAVGTVRSRLHRARAMLIERLRAAGDGARQTLDAARCFA